MAIKHLCATQRDGGIMFGTVSASTTEVFTKRLQIVANAVWTEDINFFTTNPPNWFNCEPYISTLLSDFESIWYDGSYIPTIDRPNP